MMKTFLFASAAAMALGGAASAQIAANGYVNVGYTYVDLDVLEFNTLTLRGGADFHPNFGVEGEALIGVGEDTIGGFDFEYSYSVAAFAKAQYPVSEQISLFARLGYSYVELDSDFGGADSDGVAFGGGGEYTFGGLNGVRVEYTRYEYENDAEADAFGISYVRRFGG